MFTTVWSTSVFPDKLAYSVAETTKATGFGRTRIYQEIKEGRLKTIKLGRRTAILAEELRRWLNELRAQ